MGKPYKKSVPAGKDNPLYPQRIPIVPVISPNNDWLTDKAVGGREQVQKSQNSSSMFDINLAGIPYVPAMMAQSLRGMASGIVDGVKNIFNQDLYDYDQILAKKRLGNDYKHTVRSVNDYIARQKLALPARQKEGMESPTQNFWTDPEIEKIIRSVPIEERSRIFAKYPKPFKK